MPCARCGRVLRLDRAVLLSGGRKGVEFLAERGHACGGDEVRRLK